MRRPGGLDWIVLTRRFQWPVVIVSLLGCLALIGLVIAGRRRVWWLLALVPVLFLFYQRFAGETWRHLSILEGPPLINAERATFLKADAPVIGLVFEESPYAYPCGSLAQAPVILHQEADKRLILMYSPYAGRAMAYAVDHSVKARELDIVSMPANAMLLYNSRIGQFINAFTGLTLDGHRPAGMLHPIQTYRTTWGKWLAEHPDTKVLGTTYSAGLDKVQGRFAYPVVNSSGALNPPPEARVGLLATTRPVAIQTEKIRVGPEVFNISAGGVSLLIFRDKSGLHIFDRAVKGDLFPKFVRKTVQKKPEVAFTEGDTNSLWTIEGRCVEGPAKGVQLRRVQIEEDLPWGTVHAFYPEVEVLKMGG